MKRLKAILTALACAISVCAPALAHDAVEIGPRICTLAGDGDLSPADALAARDTFDCSEERLRKATDHLWLVADVEDLTAEHPNPMIRTRMSYQRDMTIHTVFANGTSRTDQYSMADLANRWRAPTSMSFDIGSATSKPVTVLIGVDTPWDPSHWKDVEILDAHADASEHLLNAVIAALFSGILFAPLILNALFYTMLRRRFLVFHSAMVGSLLVYAVFWSGLGFELFPGMSILTRSAIDHLMLATAFMAGTLLVRDLCEPEKLGPTMRTTLLVTSMIPLAWILPVMMLAPRFPLVASEIYHLLFTIPLFAIVIALTVASLRGSKIAMVQMLGWSGIFVLTMHRILRGLGILGDGAFFDIGFLPLMMFETFFTASIVAHRVLQLRREWDEAVKAHSSLVHLAETDYLTGVANRRSFVEHFNALASQKERRTLHWTLMVLDIDYFKRVNDSFGHTGGDVALIEFADLLKSHCREHDICARIGGEEFAMLVATPDQNGGVNLAKRLRRAVEDHDFGNETYPVGCLTVSIGVVKLKYSPEFGFSDHYTVADDALYEAKKSGRNRVVEGKALPAANDPRGEPANDNPLGLPSATG